MYEELEEILLEGHEGCDWYEKFRFTDCKTEIIERIIEWHNRTVVRDVENMQIVAQHRTAYKGFEFKAFMEGWNSGIHAVKNLIKAAHSNGGKSQDIDF